MRRIAIIAIFMICTVSCIAAKPNIVFFLVDDMGWTDLGCYGSSFYESPRIDKLCSEGMKFTQAYCASGVCSPTRASIITGQHPARTGCTQWGWSIRGTERCFAEDFRDAGYATFFTGKWHVGGKSPAEAGFEYDLELSARSKDKINDPKSTLKITKNTLSFLKKDAGDRPFLAYVNYHSVHTPLRERADLVTKYAEKLKSDPPKPGSPKGLEMEGDRDNKQVQDKPEFAAMVEGIDDSVEEILKAVEKMGQGNNTLVIFTSDNGGLSTKPCTSNLPLRAGKGWLYEGGVRVPTIVKWPGVVKPGSRCDEPIYSTDYYPTMLASAGLDLRPDDHADGISILPLLKGEDELPRDALYWHYPHNHGAGNSPSGSILHKGYKLVTYFGTDRTELYHIEEDLSELTDLAGEMPEKVKELMGMLKQWHKQFPDIRFGEGK